MIKELIPLKMIRVGGCFISTGYKYMRIEGENNDPGVIAVDSLRDDRLLTFGENDRVLPVYKKN